MNFFSYEWWQSGCQDADIVFARYRSHFDSIASQLSDSLRHFDASYTLHDSRLVTLNFKVGEKALCVNFDGWNRQLSEPMFYELTFGEIQSFEQKLPRGRKVDSEFGDLGYWELALVPSEIEFRFLFASSAEMQLCCRSFDFKAIPKP